MNRFIVRIGGIAAAGGAALLLAAGPALASTSARAWVTGPESISGSAFGKAANANNPRIPLVLRGVVTTTDRNFVLGGKGSTHTLRTPAGRLTVRGIGRQHTTEAANPRVCHLTFTIRQQFSFVGRASTGSFAGASGPGAYQVSFGAFYPRYSHGRHRGKCNFSEHAKPFNAGAVVTFLAAGVLTVR
jgi:hypothetical protein